MESGHRNNIYMFTSLLCFSSSVSVFVHTSNFPALTPELKSTLDKVVTSHKVVLFMKGTKDFPQCGFSNTVVQILKSLNVPFETINILENEILRQGLKEYSSWPTFPQLYIEGEFFGGCDITVGMLLCSVYNFLFVCCAQYCFNCHFVTTTNN